MSSVAQVPIMKIQFAVPHLTHMLGAMHISNRLNAGTRCAVKGARESAKFPRLDRSSPASYRTPWRNAPVVTRVT
jgi:hypothetical protein